MSAPTLVDTHCHLQFQAFRMDGPQVIRAALAAKIWMIIVGTQSVTSAQAVSAAERHPQGVYAAVGLHPSHLQPARFDENEFAAQTEAERFDVGLYAPLAANPKVAAIGECGMDLYRMPLGVNPAEVKRIQEEQFRLQLSFADANDLPVIVHCREAHEPLVRILRSAISAGGIRRRGVIHSFSGNWKEAEQYLDLGFRIGFNGIVTFPPKKGQTARHQALIEVIKKIPPDMFLLETDAPYLSPEPRRGERNRPEYVMFVAEKMAEIRGLTLDRLASMSTYNAQKLFHRIKI